MSKFAKMLGAAALIAGAFTLTAGSAQAQWRHGHHGYHHGYHHGGYGGGFAFGFGAPYAYYPAPYYGPACRYERIRFWRHGRWHWRSVRRCY